MQISRHLLLACAVATCLTPVVSLRAYDNEAQIRARQALEDKLSQMDAQTNAPAPAATPAPAKKAKKSPPPAAAPAPAATPAPAETSSAPAAATAPKAAPVDAATAEKLREALDQQMGNTQPAPAPTPAPATHLESVQAPAPEVSQPATPMAPKAAPVDAATAEKLREALDQQTGNTQPAPAPTPAPVTHVEPVVTPAATPVPVQAETPAPQAEPVNIAPETNDAESQKLRDALHEKMSETQPQPAPAPVAVAPAKKVKKAPAPQPTPAPAAAPVVVAPAPKPAAPMHVAAAPAPQPAPAPMYSSAPTLNGSASSEQLNEALNEKMSQTAPSATVPTTPMAPSAKALPLPTYSLPALVGPPSPLPAAKQQKLDVLLQQYRMDQITPAQYHEERAKILAEP